MTNNFTCFSCDLIAQVQKQKETLQPETFKVIEEMLYEKIVSAKTEKDFDSINNWLKNALENALRRDK